MASTGRPRSSWIDAGLRFIAVDHGLRSRADVLKLASRRLEA